MKVHELEELLASHRFFEVLEPSDLSLIAGCGRTAHFPAGTHLATEGAPADRFFVIRRGRVAVEVHAPGRGQLVLATAGPGDVVGWSWLFDPYRWSFDVRAESDVRAIELDGACLRRKADEDPALGHRLMKRFAVLLASQLEATRLRLLDLYGSATPATVTAGDPHVG